MSSTDRPRQSGHVPLRVVIVTAIALLTPLFWLAVQPGAVAQGAVISSTAAQGSRVTALSAVAHDSPHNPQGQEGPVAKIVSVIGIILVLVCIVGLGSLSVRRRTRDRPPAGDANQNGPRGRDRGPFDEWFRTRR
jgi:beta-lactamase regulating signal transducer with metallopeptidase domain